jgi:hypothetical protein
MQLTDQAVAESRERLAPTGWPVAADYRIEDGLVVPCDERRQRIPHRALDAAYMPQARPELPGEFAKVSGGDEKGVLMFVRRYGLLGYADALTPFEENVLRGTRSTATYDPLIDKTYNTELPGDPVVWILAHADTVGFILALGADLDRPKELRRIFEQKIVTDGDVDELRFVRAVRGRTRPKQGHLPVPQSDAQARATALDIIALALADNLAGVTRQVVRTVKGLASFFRFNNLLDHIYWMLADAVTGRRIRQCPECGHFFIAETDRVKYCPRPMGQQGVSSLCMHRMKVRKWRDRERRKQRRGVPPLPTSTRKTTSRPTPPRRRKRR